jgi:hypothetical protein
MKSSERVPSPPRPEREIAVSNAVYLPKLRQRAAGDLRKAILAACEDFERSLRESDKDFLRGLHVQAKQQNPGYSPKAALALFAKHRKHFRDGCEIDLSKIKPVLQLVAEDDWADLFYITRSMWSMPYTKGYGRRLRFVVYDEHHEGVMGVIGLQSPPADLGARDELFRYPSDRKLELVNCTMDAFAVGAVPPYSYLLGGKLCAGLVASDEVRQAYWRHYAGKKSQMLERGIQQPLAAITTTSAFGRSSQYNRLKYHNRVLAEPIGYTLGYGTMHLEHLYERMCTHLKVVGKFTEGGFGNGPKVRWQNISRTLSDVGLPKSLLRHGVKREVFIYRLVDELAAGMAGEGFGVPFQLSTDRFADYWKDRWAIPRANRFPDWNKGKDTALLATKLEYWNSLCP